MNKYKEFSSSKIPDKFIEGIANALRNYSTALIRLSVGEDEKAIQELMGSGTFVTIGDMAGILTAHHVANQFLTSDGLGLTLIENEQNATIPWKHIRHIEVATPVNDEHGPDLSFLVLPKPNLEGIMANKSFYPLSPIQKDNQAKRDPWFVYGTIGERTTKESPNKGFVEVKGYYGFGGMTFAENIFSKGEFDYVEVKADYGERDTPRSFGGMSGGGLWRAPLLINDDEKIVAKGHFLSGVIFYQTSLKDGARFLRCHGPESLNVVYDAVIAQTK